MPGLIMSCNLERIGPRGDKGETLFSLNLSAAFAGDRAPEPAQCSVLRPWAWQLRGVDARQVTTTTSQPLSVVLLPRSPDVEHARAEFAPLLQQRYEQYLTPFDARLFQWPGSAGPDARQPLRGDADPLRRIPWAGVLAQVGAYPYPLPHSVNLVLFFRATVPDNTGVVVAPRITFLDDGGDTILSADVACDPTAFRRPETAGEPWVVTYNQPPIPSFPLTAEVQATPPVGTTPTPPARAVINLQTLWQSDVQVTDDDWLASLENDLASHFDVAQRVIDAMREVLSSASQPLRGQFDAAVPTLRVLVTRLLQDVVTTGMDPDLTGRRLIDILLQGFDEANRVQVVNAMAKADVSHEKWKGLVATKVSSTAGSPALTVGREWQASSLASEVEQLEQLQSALTDESALQAIVFQTWRDALAGNPTLARTAVEYATGRARLVQFRAHLLKARLALEWSAIAEVSDTSADDDLQQVRNNFTSAFARHATGRIKAVIAQLKLTLDAAVLARLLESINDYAKTASLAIVPSKPTRQLPQPVVFKVDRVGRREDPGDDASDYVRHLAGVGVLLRQKGTGNWHCLNMAAARLANQPPHARPALSGLVVPMPLHDAGAFRQAFVAYDNGPLVAQSPAARLSTYFSPEPSNRTSPDDLLTYLNSLPYERSTGVAEWSWSQLPQLIYGRELEAAVFYIANGGVLPEALAVDDAPARLRPFGITTLPPQANIRGFNYRRKVPFGSARIVQKEELFSPRPIASGAKRDALLPEIPPTVNPRAQQIAEDLAQADKTLSAEERAAPMKRPVLLLAPASMGGSHPNTFQFYLRPPTVGLTNWDRWVAGSLPLVPDSEVRRARVRVWADYHERSEQNADGGHFDVTLDEPGILGRYWIELTLLDHIPGRNYVLHKDGQPATTIGGPQTLRFEVGFSRLAQPDPDKLDPLRWQSVTVVCDCRDETSAPNGDSDQIVVTVTDASVRLSAPPGVVLSMTTFIMIDQQAHGRCDDAITASFTKTADGAFIGAPMELLIETATRTFPTDAELGDALVGRFDPATSRLDLRLRLKADSKLEFVGRAELMRQVWRWSGRPVRPLPSDAWTMAQSEERRFGLAPGVAGTSAIVPGDAIRDWEGRHMGERRDNDHEVVSMARADRMTFRYVEELSTQPQARYFRFAVRAFSRYEGLFGGRDQSQSDHSESWGSDKTPAQWLRLPVKCRPQTAIPKPAVKILLPLADLEYRDHLDRVAGAKPQAATSPGVLLVVSGAWFDWGGLAEQLAVDVQLAEPIIGELDAPRVPELGPDPIVTGRAAGLNFASSSMPLIEAIGPIGHTRDLDAASPSFAATSFILKPPVKIVAGKAEPMPFADWDFVRVRFRRTLHGTSVAEAPGSLPGFVYTSESTQPFWTQFLPPLMVSDPLRNVDTYFIERDGEAITVKNKTNGQPIKMLREGNLFVQYVLITASIHETSGHEGHETFVTVLRPESWPNPNGRWVPMTGFDGPLPSAPRARFVEVQFTPSAQKRLPESLQQLWEALFPQDATRDAEARVVGTSWAIKTAVEAEVQ